MKYFEFKNRLVLHGTNQRHICILDRTSNFFVILAVSIIYDSNSRMAVEYIMEIINYIIKSTINLIIGWTTHHSLNFFLFQSMIAFDWITRANKYKYVTNYNLIGSNLGWENPALNDFNRIEIYATRHNCFYIDVLLKSEQWEMFSMHD